MSEPAIPTTDAAPKPTEPAAQPAETEPAHHGIGRDAHDEGSEKDAGSEAAKYRRRLRDTEGQLEALASEHEALAGRVERMQLAEVGRLTADRLAVPADLLAFGLRLGDLLNEDGDVSAALVDTAVLGLLSSRPGLRAVPPSPKGPTSYGQGIRPGVPAEAKPTWSDALKRG